MDGPFRFGDWIVVRPLGSGGQGDVYLVRRLSRRETDSLRQDLESLANGKGYRSWEERDAGLVHLLSAVSESPIGALKKLGGTRAKGDPKKAEERRQRELLAMKEVEHPALVRLLDTSEDNSWFVMEYHKNGSLTSRLGRYSAKIEKSLTDIRPLVEAVSMLHSRSIIHRDIKPDNILVGVDESLILGDFGIVFSPDSSGDARLTSTLESVGTHDWMPPWAIGARVDALTGTFDVFGLGKILWAMLSGGQFLRLHYFQDDEFNLEKIHPRIPGMKQVNQFLARCITERPNQAYQDASEMLGDLDSLANDFQRIKGESSADADIAKEFFPGTWMLHYDGTPPLRGKEQVQIASGVYIANGRDTFRIRARRDVNDNQIIVFKTRIDGSQEFREQLLRLEEDVWIGADQFGTRLKYERQRPAAASTTTTT